MISAISQPNQTTRSLHEEGGRVYTLTELLVSEAIAPRWALPNLALRGEVSMLFAAAGTGKTTLYHEAIVANAEERAFLGLLPFEERQAILVFDWENSPAQVARSVQRLSLGKSVGDAATFYIDLLGHNLDTEAGRQQVRAAAVAYEASVLVFDNRDRAFPNTPELDGGQVSESMSRVKGLAQELDVAILLVSHEPKTQYSGAIDKLRGHSAWAAFSDQMFNLDWPGGGVRRLRHVKHRGVDLLPPLQIRRLAIGDRDTGHVELVAQVDLQGLSADERLTTDVTIVEEILKEVGPMGSAELKREFDKKVDASTGKKRLYKALGSSRLVEQPEGKGGKWQLGRGEQRPASEGPKSPGPL
jgi:hypothetical protein